MILLKLNDMKKLLIFIVLSLFIQANILGQKKMEHDHYKELVSFSWNSTDPSVQTEMLPSGIIGIADYDIIGDSLIALLCNVEKTLKIYRLDDNSLVRKINLFLPFSEIAVDTTNKLFYLKFTNVISQLDFKGEVLQTFKMNRNIKFIFNFFVSNGDLMVTTTRNKVYQFTNGINPIDIKKQLSHISDNWLFADGSFGEIKRIDHFNIEMTIVDKSAMQIKSTHTFKKGIGSVYFIGKDDAFIQIKLEFIEQASPLKFGEQIILFDIKANQWIEGSFLPSICYMIDLRTARHSKKGIYYMLTTENNAKLYFLSNQALIKRKSFSPDLSYYYHVNFNLPEYL